MGYKAVPMEIKARAAWAFLTTRNDIDTTCSIYGVTRQQLSEYIRDDQILHYLADSRPASYENLVEYRNRRLVDIQTYEKLVLD